MIIGIDFDNTIVCYDRIFHDIALERSLIPADLPVSKGEVRDYLRRIDREDDWTEMQGYVYGARMVEADPFPDVYRFFQHCLTKNHNLYIISHRTRYPFLGEQYDLHSSAYAWLKAYHFLDGANGFLKDENVFFELTKADKIARIKSVQCDCFIDDLPEFLSEAGFPSYTRKILFDPNNLYGQISFERVLSWRDASDLIADA